jgi:serine/threonine protein kinase
VWQLGCLLYVLYFIDFPFNDNNEILNLNLRLKISLEARAIPTHIAKFLRMMLSKEENDRPTLAQVYDFLPSLDHEYLSPVTKISSDTKEDPSLDVDVEYSPMDELLGDPRVGKITKYDLFDDKDPSRVGYRSAIKVDSRVGKMKKDSPAKKPSLRGIGRLGLGRFFRGPRKKE